jgi:hypothetical protein
MAEEKAALREIHWRHVFPWLAIFRTFGIALDLKKMALGGLGALTMVAGWFLLAYLFETVASENVQVQEAAAAVRHWPWEAEQWASYSVSSDQEISRFINESGDKLTPAMRHELRLMVRERSSFQIVDELLRDPFRTLWQLGTNWRFVLKPVQDLVRPFRGVFSRENGFVSTVFTLVCGLWGALVWAFFGGAITRIAAVQFARDEKIGLKESVQFAASKFLSYGCAPAIPLGFIAFFAFLCLVGGLISWIIPGFGPIFAGVLWVLPLVAGFVMAIILVGWAVGWPLMFSTISVEGSDSFDALSRSFAYIFQRPWHYLFYALLAVVFGSLCSFFVVLFADLLVHMTHWAVAWGGGERLATLLGQLFYYAPDASGWGPGAEQSVDKPTGATWFGAVCTGIWLYLLFFLLVGFVYSYFWSASTVIYYLLRRDVDNTEMQEVFLEGEADDMGMPSEPTTPTSPVVAPSEPPPAAQ